MAYGVVATTARAVNTVKGRPVDQNVAVSLHDRSLWRELAPSLNLPPAVLGPVVSLLRRRFGLLLPLGEVSAPAWTAPATRDGKVAVFNGYWEALGWLWQHFPRLYGSSANRTGRAPATSVPEARGIFGGGCAVAAPETSEAPVERWSSTMIDIDCVGRISLHRSGAQDRSSALTAPEFIKYIARSVGLRPSPRGTTS